MSKFCANCGAQADDAAMVCGNCGTPFEAAPAGAPAPVAKAGLQKYIKPIIAAVVAVIIIILGVNIFGGGAKSAAKKAMKAMIKGDEKTMTKILSARYGDEDSRESVAEMLAGEKDDDLKITYKVKDTKTLDKDDLKDIKKNVAAGGEIDEDDVKKAVKVKFEVTAKDKDSGDKETNTISFIMTKEKGSWKLYDVRG